MPHGPTAHSQADDLVRQERVRRNQGAIQILLSRVDLGDEEEQRETLAYLKHAITLT